MDMDRFQIADDVAISRIAYGMWRIVADPDTSPAHVQAKIEACLVQGITTMDQADIYGDYGAEAVLGNALAAAPGLRDRIEIVTKCGIVAPIGRHAGARVKYYDTSAAHITASVEASLRAMRTDRIDLLLIHRPNPMMTPAETGRALDVLVAEQTLRVMDEMIAQHNTGLIFISHDLGLVSSFCDRVLVMYGGQVVEHAPVRELFANPQHPYTRALLAASPQLHQAQEWLPTMQRDPRWREPQNAAAAGVAP